MGGWVEMVGCTWKGERRVGRGSRGVEWVRVLVGEYQVWGARHCEWLCHCVVKTEERTIQRYLRVSAGQHVQRAGTPPPSSPQTYNLGLTYMRARGTPQDRPSQALAQQSPYLGKS